jgi:hypothetical protein
MSTSCYQLRNYDRDRYLVGLLQVTNEQLRQQIGDPREARRNYFESLLATQKEVRRLQAGFGQPGDYLYDKAADLDAEITRIVQAGIIDKTTKAAIEDALQLLTMAADDPSIAANEDPVKNLTNEQRARMRAALPVKRITSIRRRLQAARYRSMIYTGSGGS